MLGIINTSPGDLTPVFDAILERAMRLCDASSGIFWTFQGGHFRPVAFCGVTEKFGDVLREHSKANNTSSRSLEAVEHGKAFVHDLDLAESNVGRSDWLARAVVDLEGARTGLLVPLLKDSSLLGAIRLLRREVRPFGDEQIALLQNFAAQAVIAIENARLLTETREALEQQTATAEVLQVINSSPGDLAPVWDAILEKATRLCEAASGILWAYDGERFEAVAQHGVPYDLMAEFRGNPSPLPTDALEAVARGANIVRNDDLSRNRGAERSVEEGGMRTGFLVAMRKGDRLLGAIRIFRHEARPFSGKQIALVENFAAQAIVAMENARLITETREALEQQTATAEVLQVINSSPGDLAPVFDAMLEKAMQLCDASGGALRAYEGGVFRAVAMRGVSAEFLAATREVRPDPETALGGIELGELVVQIDDIADPEHPRAQTSSRRDMVELAGIRTSLWVALRKNETLLGTFVLYRKEVRRFNDNEIALVQNFAAQAVVAMENARLLGELRQRTEEVAELNRGLEARVAEQVEELGRVGRLKRFLAPQLAELIVSQGDEKILESHRREIVVVFCDLRGYTAFTETAEPEEVLDFLREYHGALGPLVSQYEGTLDQFSGDGIMVFFNDPMPVPDAAERAVNMAGAMREAAGSLIADWRERGRDLGFGAGIAQGYATLGQIGFSERSGYTAIGTVCNVAARLCGEAKDGQILLSQRVNAALKGSVATEPVGALPLKGLSQPVMAYNVPLLAPQPALRLIEGGPQSV